MRNDILIIILLIAATLSAYFFVRTKSQEFCYSGSYDNASHAGDTVYYSPDTWYYADYGASPAKPEINPVPGK
jgi:hypothetical protein